MRSAGVVGFGGAAEFTQHRRVIHHAVVTLLGGVGDDRQGRFLSLKGFGPLREQDALCAAHIRQRVRPTSGKPHLPELGRTLGKGRAVAEDRLWERMTDVTGPLFRLDPDQRHAGLVNKCRHNLINGLPEALAWAFRNPPPLRYLKRALSSRH